MVRDFLPTTTMEVLASVAVVVVMGGQRCAERKKPMVSIILDVLDS